MGERYRRYVDWVGTEEPAFVPRMRKFFRGIRSKRGYTKSLTRLGVLQGRVGRYQEALELFDEAVTVARGQRKPDLLGVSLSLQALYRAELDDDEGAVTAATEAIQLLDPLFAEKPRRYAPFLLQARRALVHALLELDRPADALASAEELVQAVRPLAAASPKYEAELAKALDYKGRCLGNLGEPTHHEETP